jgi:hypothetical protein
LLTNVTPQGGTIKGVPVIVSDGVPDGEIIILDPMETLQPTALEPSISVQADVQLDTAPDSPNTASTVLRSLWQADQVGLLLRYFMCEKLRARVDRSHRR